MCMVLQVGEIENYVDPDEIVHPAASYQGSANRMQQPELSGNFDLRPLKTIHWPQP